MACKTLQPIASSAARRLSCSPFRALSLRPGFVQNLDKFKEQGIEVACVAVNDPFVMKAWSEAGNAEGITMLADGNGTFIKALGLELDEPVTVSVPAHSALRFTPKIA